jgi:uncharacterized membrane protein (DUF106 family)
MAFLTVFLASALGTILANLAIIFLIGWRAIQQEKKQVAELQKQHQSYLEMVRKESLRMQNYARMEG